MTPPLHGITVVDLSLQLPGPFCTLLLAALGARVVKVEPPDGDPARRIDPPMFERVNAGKALLRIDLKSAEGRERLEELVASADVFVEGFRPGVAARLGCDWAALSERNDRLVYCSLSGFGPEGPLAQRAGHDLNFLGLAAGVAAGTVDGEALIRIPFVDLAAGTNAALAIVAALHARGLTGRGRHLDMALLDAAVVWSLAKLPREGGAEGAYGLFATADGGQVAVSVMETPMWERLCRALGWADWAADDTLRDHDARRARADAIRGRLSASIERLTQARVLELADSHDLPITAVNSVDTLRSDPQIATRALLDGDRSWAPLGRAGTALPFADP